MSVRHKDGCKQLIELYMRNDRFVISCAHSMCELPVVEISLNPDAAVAVCALLHRHLYASKLERN